jgi:hypothetical protein
MIRQIRARSVFSGACFGACLTWNLVRHGAAWRKDGLRSTTMILNILCAFLQHRATQCKTRKKGLRISRSGVRISPGAPFNFTKTKAQKAIRRRALGWPFQSGAGTAACSLTRLGATPCARIEMPRPPVRGAHIRRPSCRSDYRQCPSRRFVHSRIHMVSTTRNCALPLIMRA